MSELFREVKADIEKEIKETNFHTAASWADIMLHNSVRLTSVQDQHSFWKWVTGNKETSNMTFCEMDPEAIVVNEFETISLDDGDEKTNEECVCHNKIFRNGMTTYIQTEIQK